MKHPAPNLNVAAVRMLVRLGGITLDDERAARVAPSLALLLAADRKLSALDLSTFLPCGDPWGRTPDDS
jgi:hypothetical protein